MSTASAHAKHDAILLFTSSHGEGHAGPLISIAGHMVERGFEVVFLTYPQYEEKVKKAGAEFLEIPGDPARFMKGSLQKFLTLQGLERVTHQLVNVFYKNIPDRSDALRQTLEMLRERYPTRQIIVVEDVMNSAVQPWKYGTPLPNGFTEFPKVVGISPHPMLIESADAAPPLMGLLPDFTDSGRARNAALYKQCEAGPFAAFHEARAAALQESGCTEPPTGSSFTVWYTCHDVSMMLCSPSLEYDLPDRPDMIRFAGCLPARGIDTSFPLPSWWSEITENSKKGKDAKSVVFVCQGTVNRQWNLLVEPTIRAFADRDNVLIVAVLAEKGANLDPSINIPSNVRVADYLPYDAVLQHADVFVTNGGYGAFSHAVMNGVPAVFAGETEEKPEVIMRAVYAGFGYNLGTQAPTPEKVRQGVDVVLGDAGYKRRAVELMEENVAMGALDRIYQIVVSLVD